MAQEVSPVTGIIEEDQVFVDFGDHEGKSILEIADTLPDYYVLLLLCVSVNTILLIIIIIIMYIMSIWMLFVLSIFFLSYCLIVIQTQTVYVNNNP